MRKFSPSESFLARSKSALLNKRRLIEVIEAVVGTKIYSTWIDMLKKLVPHGRTHRISVVIASMLQYAHTIAYEKQNSSPEARKLLDMFDYAYDNYMEGNITEILSLTESLLKDANVKFKRVSSRGDVYSIAEEAVYHYLHWENMPWES